MNTNRDGKVERIRRATSLKADQRLLGNSRLSAFLISSLDDPELIPLASR